MRAAESGYGRAKAQGISGKISQYLPSLCGARLVLLVVDNFAINVTEVYQVEHEAGATVHAEQKADDVAALTGVVLRDL